MLRALLLAVLGAAPALAFAQAEGATGDPTVERLERPGLFRSVPKGPDGKPREYVPPRPPTPPPPDLAPAERATLRLLDKMTGQVDTFEMRPGETRRHARLTIALGRCMTPAQDAREDAVAWLEIRDVREDAPSFRGWMFASSPALSALDHARYDLWVLSCSTVSDEASSANE